MIMKNSISVFLFAILFLNSTKIWGITNFFSQYNYTFLTEDIGLPNNFVRYITKDSDGYIWAATHNGIARYDGYSFTTFNSYSNPIKLKGDVVFDGVDFGYTDEKMVLHDVKLYATPGQKIAFVGSTGAGKTTITNLINRFYDIQDGKIRYDGININKIKKADLRRSLGIVLQDTHLFTGTVKENIIMGKPYATDEEIIEASKKSYAHSFIKRLPDGYDTYIGTDGGNLSGGQKQLLCITRLMLVNPPMLILDEATSSIDTRTDIKIQTAFNNLMRGKTTFIVAHRLSTIKNADLILVMNNGSVIETGTHNELLAKKGFYFNLYSSQFAGFE